MIRGTSRTALWTTLAMIGAAGTLSPAADPPSKERSSLISDIFGQANDAPAKLTRHQPQVQFALLPADARPGDSVTLSITVKVPENGYTYSTSPKFSGGTRIKIAEAAGLEPIDKDFQSSNVPKSVFEPAFDHDVEKHFVDVTWSRKYRLRSDANPAQVSITGKLDYQVCDDKSCMPYRGVPIAVALGEGAASPASSAPVAPAEHPYTFHLPFEFSESPEVRGSGKPAEVTALLSPPDAKPGQEVTLSVTLKPHDPWHSYSLTQDPTQAALPTKLETLQLNGLRPVDDKWTPSRPHEDKSIQVGKETYRQQVYEGEVTWSKRFVVEGSASPTKYGVDGQISYQLCTDRTCLRPATVNFSLGTIIKLPATMAKPVSSAAGSAAVAADENTGPTQTMGLVPFLIAAVTAGFLALLTPCVFPMIPITVSFFLKRAESEHHRPIAMALVYCLGIVVTFTALGLLMAVAFEASSLNTLANNSWLNLALAGMLIFFGMNLLGLFEIRMPAWLLTWSSRKEGQGGFIGTLFMAFTFTLVSFTCTFTFAGLLLVWAAKGDYFWPIVGMVAFSAAFSLPFFFLALFPSYLQRLPKSGGWMNRVKVVMGMVELGAAFKFLSVADFSANPVPIVFDYALVMTAWMVLSICTGLYLLGLFRTPHDTPSESVGVIRLTSAMLFLGWAVYLGVGMFATTKPTGKLWEQVDAFAPARIKGGEGDVGPFVQHEDLKFALDYEMAVKYAQANNTPLFLDFTGVNCVNCRLMEVKMQSPHNREKLAKLVLVQLYTDNIPGIQDQEKVDVLLDKNRNLQQNWFGDVTLPSYAVVAPDGTTLLSTFKGLEQSDGEFAQFLQLGLEKWKQLQTAGGTGVARR